MPSERQQEATGPTWLSASHRSTPMPPAERTSRGPGAKITGRKAFHQAKQTNLFSFYGKEPAAPAGEATGRGRDSRASSARVTAKGKGRELSSSSSDDAGDASSRPPARKKARASEPLPQTALCLSRRSESAAPIDASSSRQAAPPPALRRPRLSAPVTGGSVDPFALPSSTEPSRRKGRLTHTASPPPPAAIKRERLEQLRGLEEDDGYSFPADLLPTNPFKRERSGPSDEDYQDASIEHQRRRRKALLVKAEPASLVRSEPASIGDACPPSQESEAYDEEDPNDQVGAMLAGQPSYHRPTSLLSESLAPYLPASYPSPQRLPQHVVDDLLSIGLPFGGTNGREKFLRRPRMPWETDEAWEARQAELRQWEVDERLRKERAARPLEPPARQPQVDEQPGRRLSTDFERLVAEGEASEPDTYFAGGPKKLHWPKPPIVPPKAPLVVDGPFGPRPPALSAPVKPTRPAAGRTRIIASPTRSSPSRASSTSPVKEPSLLPGEESYTLPATHPYSRPFIPTAPGALGPAPSALSLHRSEASGGEGSYTVLDSHRFGRRPQAMSQGAPATVQAGPSALMGPTSPGRDSQPQPLKAVPRRLTEEEETSVILEIDWSRASASPERLASLFPQLGSTGTAAAFREDLDVVPSSQTEEAPSLFAPMSSATGQAGPGTRTPGPSPARILVLASQETAQQSPLKQSTPRRRGLAASQPSLRSGGEALTPSRRLANSPSQSSPSRLASVVPASPFQQSSADKANPSPARSLVLTTPTHGRTHASEDNIVPTSVAAERPENDLMLVWQRAKAQVAADKSASPTPTRKGARAAGRLPPASVGRPSAVAVTSKTRPKPRMSWPVWTGVGLIDADASIPTGDDDHDDELAGVGEAANRASLLAASKPLAQDSLLQHGFGRSVVCAPRPPSPETAVPLDEAITDEEDEADVPVFDDSVVPSSQSLAPLGWGVRRYGDVPASGKKVAPIPSPPPRAVLARPSRYKPPRSPVKVAFAHDLTRIAASKTRSPTPSPRKAETADPDVTLVKLSQPHRSSDPSTSEDEEDEVDADVTLLAPPPFDLSFLSQGTVPDSQPATVERRSSPELMPPPSSSSRPPLRALLQAESTNYEWLRSSSGSSGSTGLDPGLETLL